MHKAQFVTLYAPTRLCAISFMAAVALGGCSSKSDDNEAVATTGGASASTAGSAGTGTGTATDVTTGGNRATGGRRATGGSKATGGSAVVITGTSCSPASEGCSCVINAGRGVCNAGLTCDSSNICVALDAGGGTGGGTSAGGSAPCMGGTKDCNCMQISGDCNPGLTCVNDICVDLTATGGTAGTGGSSAAGGAGGTTSTTGGTTATGGTDTGGAGTGGTTDTGGTTS
jgi:hypothetical protein